ncbi:uncharacterized protein LOC142563448 [Dermacentor variabilis]|uniref:uncharacterized protein LOC142563448 n=1 Tax=Dermacentor variabilis TaxID=34621 RepID=UPI003F5B9BAD
MGTRLTTGERCGSARSIIGARLPVETSVMHLNLDHARRALAAATRRMAEFGIPIAAINDPPCTKRVRPQLPPDFSYFGEEEEPLSAIFVRQPDFDVFPVYVSRRVVAVRCSTRDREWMLVAAYAPPHVSIEPTLDEISDCLDGGKTPEVLVMGDFNAKHAMWGPRANDNRSSRLIEFAAAHGLVVLNDAASPPTYSTLYTDSWIDVTLATPALVRRGYRWCVSPDETFSEHRAIDLVLHSDTVRGKRLTKCGPLNFVAELREIPWFRRAAGADIRSPRALDALLEKMYVIIDRTLTKHVRPVVPHKPGKSWWTP